MNYTLVQWAQSNVEITITCTADDMIRLKQDALKQFQEEISLPGFRKGHVPLEMVEQQVKAEYLSMSIVEAWINQSLKKVIKEHPELALIGEPYDLHMGDAQAVQDMMTKGLVISLKLDLYPQVTVSNNKREKLTLDTIDAQPTAEEVENSFMQLRKQYASYDEQETIEDNSIVKIKVSYTNKEWQEIHKTSLFVWAEEYTANPGLLDLIKGKHVADVVEVIYSKKLPELLLLKDDQQAHKIHLNIDKIYVMILPEMSPENIKKFFGDDTTVSDEAGIRAEITKTIKEQKQEYELQTAIDKLLEQAKGSLSVIIPASLKQRELESRIETLKQRMGGEEKYQEYLTKIWAQEQEKMMNEIKDATNVSLEKFFLFRKLTELLEITDIDRDKQLDAEKKLYAKLAK